MLAKAVATTLVSCTMLGWPWTLSDFAPRTTSPILTTAGLRIVASEPVEAAISELRRLSGLTWDQLARIFQVHRRSLHFWASGKAMAPNNEEHLQRVLAIVRKLDRGSANANRSALLGTSEDGILPLDLLVAGHYDQVLALLGQNKERRKPPPKLPGEARETQTRSPEELVDALQDRVHPANGRLLAAKVVCIPRRK